MGRTAELVNEKGYRVVNIDSTVVLQNPKLKPYIPEMEKVMADILDMEVDGISVKATTTENLGFEGRGEGVSASAVCLLRKKINEE